MYIDVASGTLVCEKCGTRLREDLDNGLFHCDLCVATYRAKDALAMVRRGLENLQRLEGMLRDETELVGRMDAGTDSGGDDSGGDVDGGPDGNNPQDKALFSRHIKRDRPGGGSIGFVRRRSDDRSGG